MLDGTILCQSRRYSPTVSKWSYLGTKCTPPGFISDRLSPKNIERKLKRCAHVEDGQKGRELRPGQSQVLFESLQPLSSAGLDTRLLNGFLSPCSRRIISVNVVPVF